MKKILTNFISSTAAQPIKQGTLDHLQAAYQEALSALAKAQIGSAYDPTKMYILTGCVNSTVAPIYTISAGAVFFNGEVYLVDAVTFTASGSNVAVATITQTYLAAANADPVTFTDGVAHNVHAIRKAVIAEALSGSGDADFSEFVATQLNLTSADTNQLTVSGTYPNKVLTVPEKYKLVYQRTIHLGDLNAAPADANTTLLSGGSHGLAAYRHIFPVVPSPASFIVQAQIRNNSYNTTAEFDKNFGCVLQLGAIGSTDFYFAISTSATSNIQDIYIDYFVYALV